MRKLWFVVSCVVLSTLVWFPTVEAQAGSEEDWGQVGQVLEGTGVNDFYGRSVAISDDGTRVVVGSQGGSPSRFGLVQVFDATPAGWVQVGDDVMSGMSNDAFSEVAMSADGNRIAVGAPWADVAGAENVGHVWVFDWNGVAWVQAGLVIEGQAGDGAGRAVALSADGLRLAVGAAASDIAATNAGEVRLYDWAGSSWTQVGDPILGAAAFDFFGAELDLSADGNRVVVGAKQNDTGGEEAGEVRVHEWSGTEWTQLGASIQGQARDILGVDVAISGDGNRVLAATQRVRSQQYSNQIDVFDLSGTEWVQSATIDGEYSPTSSEPSIALSSDGKRLAFGHPDYSVIASSAGHVTMFNFDGARWSRIGTDIDGAQERDNAGAAVAVSGDGSRVAVGSIRPGSPPRSGQAQVFQLGTTCADKLVTIDMNTNGGSGIGTAGPDVMLGTPGDDTIMGLGGNDTICGGAGRDRIRAGGGADLVFGGDAIDRIWGDAGNDEIHGEGGSDRIRAGFGNDTVFAGSGADRVWGDDGDDVLNGMGGQDFMWGGPGADMMQGNFQSDEMRGGDGNDVIRGAGGKDRLYGDAGDDELFGGANTDYLEGGDGIDVANGQKGRDRPLVRDVSGCDAETLISC